MHTNDSFLSMNTTDSAKMTFTRVYYEDMLGFCILSFSQCGGAQSPSSDLDCPLNATHEGLYISLHSCRLGVKDVQLVEFTAKMLAFGTLQTSDDS